MGIGSRFIRWAIISILVIIGAQKKDIGNKHLWLRRLNGDAVENAFCRAL